MRNRWSIALFVILASSSAFALSISPGDSREKVIATYGYPASHAKAGEKEIFNYREGSVVLQNGKVVETRFTRAEPRLVRSPAASPTSPQRQVNEVRQPPTKTYQESSPKPILSEARGNPTITSLPKPVARLASNRTPGGFETWTYVALVLAGVLISSLLLKAVFKFRRQKWESALTDDVKKTPATVSASRLIPQLQPKAEPNRRNLEKLSTVGSELTHDLLLRLEWRRFEELAHGFFELQNWKPQRSHVGADGGIDLFLYRDGQGRPGAIVQCKAHHKPIDVKYVREFFGVMASERIDEGYFVSRSGYTVPAREFAEGKTLRLITGDDLVSQFSSFHPEARRRVMSHVFRDDFETPTCASCDVKMVRRESEDKSVFWGCRNFPRFRKTMTMRVE